MRIAVAGGGGLGYMIATQLFQAEAAYNVIVLSRAHRPEYDSLGIQVLAVDYNRHDSLRYALRGIDLCISTVAGPEQINLIMASADSGVRLFVPSEFEGSMRQRPAHDPMDRGSIQAMSLLKHLDSTKRMKYTIFSCGLFMERFSPYGLGHFQIGYGTSVASPGDYLLDARTGVAEYVELNQRRRNIQVCLTSVFDLVKFIVAAIDLGPGEWPKEWTLRGDRKSIRELLTAYSAASNIPITPMQRSYADLELYINHYIAEENSERVGYYRRLLDTAHGRYDFERTTLNEVVDASDLVDVEPLDFNSWLASVWQAGM
ncbi:hypothetical protein N3K66_004280 [Trichothecium roseum]|uniref:Uncharacterized protein n=1 Tax=Trichothecium roseum TaxID=47278 RepID=A0ACC0V2T1_9HYPO|nr:hypothetical protein N3K66_004280 [Trichothecium roseum]